MNVAFNMDCMEAMREMPDKAFDLAIVDPPYFKGVANRNFYGSDFSSSGVKRLCSESGNWDGGIPSAEYYEELTRVSKEQIIWGCNYYKFLQPTGRIVWDKKNDTSTFSNCELASVSLINSVKIYRYEWNGMLQENMKNKERRIHPTQKPVALYEWLLTNYAKPGDRILDTHLGSGSSRIAAYNLGFDFTGYEIDADYFKAQEERFAAHTSQMNLFIS